MTSSASSAQTNEGAGIDEAAFALAIVVFLFHIFFVGKLYFARNRGGNARKSAKTEQPQSILSMLQMMQRIESLEKGALTTEDAVRRWQHPVVADDGEGASTLVKTVSSAGKLSQTSTPHGDGGGSGATASVKETEEKAATTVRKNMKEDAAREKAATTIQAAYRGHAVRKTMKEDAARAAALAQVAVIQAAEANTINAEARLKEDAAKATALAQAKRHQRLSHVGIFPKGDSPAKLPNVSGSPKSNEPAAGPVDELTAAVDEHTSAAADPVDELTAAAEELTNAN